MNRFDSIARIDIRLQLTYKARSSCIVAAARPLTPYFPTLYSPMTIYTNEASQIGCKNDQPLRGGHAQSPPRFARDLRAAFQQLSYTRLPPHDNHERQFTRVPPFDLHLSLDRTNTSNCMKATYHTKHHTQETASKDVDSSSWLLQPSSERL